MGVVTMSGFTLRRCQPGEYLVDLNWGELSYEGVPVMRMPIKFARKMVRVFAKKFPVFGVDMESGAAAAYLINGGSGRKLLRLPHRECSIAWAFIHKVTGQGRRWIEGNRHLPL